MELCGKRQFLHGGDAAKCHIRALVVVRPEPTRGHVLYLVDRVEEGSREPGIAYGSVIALNVGVLLRLARLDVLDADTLLLRPGKQSATDVFRPVIAADCSRLATPLDDLLQGTDHASGWEREIDLDAQSFAVEVIQHVEQPEAAPVAELVVHEVHRPHLVDGIGHRQRLGPLAHDALPGLDAKIQFQLPVDTVDPFVIPAVALDIA